MRILFVSAQFPQEFSRSVYGGFQRMRMWLDAMQSLGADLDILFFPSAGVVPGSESASAVARQLLELWKIRSNVVLCEREPEEPPAGLLADYFAAYIRPAL